MNSILCKNMNFIAKDCNILMDNLSKHYVKQNLTYLMIPLDSNWKIQLISELLNVRSNLISIDNFDNQELNKLICSFYVPTNSYK